MCGSNFFFLLRPIKPISCSVNFNFGFVYLRNPYKERVLCLSELASFYPMLPDSLERASLSPRTQGRAWRVSDNV